MINLLAAIDIDKETIFNSLEIFWKGMLAIAVVIAIIFTITFLMTFFSPAAIRERVEKKQAKGKYDDRKK